MQQIMGEIEHKFVLFFLIVIKLNSLLKRSEKREVWRIGTSVIISLWARVKDWCGGTFGTDSGVLPSLTASQLLWTGAIY